MLLNPLYTAPLPAGFTSGTVEIKSPGTYVDAAGRVQQPSYRFSINADGSLTSLQTGGTPSIVGMGVGDRFNAPNVDVVIQLNVAGAPVPLRSTYQVAPFDSGSGTLKLQQASLTAPTIITQGQQTDLQTLAVTATANTQAVTASISQVNDALSLSSFTVALIPVALDQVNQALASGLASVSAVAGTIAYAGGDHTTLPAGIGLYRIVGSSAAALVEAGQIWERTAGGVARRPELEAVSTASLAKRVAVSVLDFGAVGDGVTDDAPAFRLALSAVSAAGGRLYVPASSYRLVMTAASIALSCGANVAIQGIPGKTILLIDTDDLTGYREFLTNAGDNVELSGLTVKRNRDFPLVFHSLSPFKGFTVDRCVYIGNQDLYATYYAHGFQLGKAGTFDGLEVTRSEFATCVYPLFQTNAATGTSKRLTFRDTLFRNNYGTDLEFNAPVSPMSDVLVDGCTFRDNMATGASAGFAVGFSHVVRATCANNTVSNYYNEAFHVEDYCSDINLVGNRLTSCGLNQGSYVQVISGSFRVKIADNFIDATANANATPINIINVLQGGGGTTPGGRASIAPSSVTVSGNDVQAGNNTHGIYFESVVTGKIIGNTLRSTGSVNAGAYGGNIRTALTVYDGRNTIVANNIINGWLYALQPFNNTINPFGQSGTVNGNIISACFVGITVQNAGALVVSGNMIYNCVKPLLAGQSSASTTPFPAVIGLNHAYGCTEPMVFGAQAMKVTSSGALAIGSGALSILNGINAYLPSGSVIQFSGGGTLTLTASSNSLAGSLTGTATGVNIASGETASVFVPFSATTAQNARIAALNGDNSLGNAAGYANTQPVTVLSKTAAYTIGATDTAILADPTTAAFTVTLPLAFSRATQSVSVKNTTLGANLVTVAPTGTDKVEGVNASKTISPLIGFRFLSDGTNWWIV